MAMQKNRFQHGSGVLLFNIACIVSVCLWANAPLSSARRGWAEILKTTGGWGFEWQAGHNGNCNNSNSAVQCAWRVITIEWVHHSWMWLGFKHVHAWIIGWDWISWHRPRRRATGMKSITYLQLPYSMHINFTHAWQIGFLCMVAGWMVESQKPHHPVMVGGFALRIRLRHTKCRHVHDGLTTSATRLCFHLCLSVC